MNDLSGEMPQKRVKTVPVKIVPNSSREGAPAPPQQMKQCKLHFDVGPPSESDGAITHTQQDPHVTIPLGFFQQLVFTAWQNKRWMAELGVQEQLKRIQIAQQAPVYQRTPKLQQKSRLYDEIMNEMVVQHQQYQQPPIVYDKHEEVFKLVIRDAIEFILHHKEATTLISMKLQHSELLRIHFLNWVKEKKLFKREDVLLVCSPNLRGESTKEEKIIELFKTLFKFLLYEYLRKHAFCDCFRQPNAETRLEVVKNLLEHILQPKDFYEFK